MHASGLSHRRGFAAAAATHDPAPRPLWPPFSPSPVRTHARTHALCATFGPCCALQEASGLYQYLREHVAAKTDNPRPLDMSSECTGLLEKLMLTQAQECVYHKAVIDKKSPAVLTRLAKQVGACACRCVCMPGTWRLAL
jgi:hypothetical protein